MTEVIKLTSLVAIWRQRCTREPIFFQDLNGQAPIDHPFASRDNWKQIQLVVGQVWVRNDSNRLWRLLEVRHTGTTSALPLAVCLHTLGGRRTKMVLSEDQLRKTMRVYEDALAHHQQKIRQRAKNPLMRRFAMHVVQGTKRPP